MKKYIGLVKLFYDSTNMITIEVMANTELKAKGMIDIISCSIL